LKLWEHTGRQEYHIGWLSSDYSKEDLLLILRNNGFEHNILAWIDDDEVLSERRRFEKGKRFQYHIRLFKDGELRGHQEISPESSPIKHSLDHVTKDFFLPADDFFNALLGDLLIKKNEVVVQLSSNI